MSGLAQVANYGSVKTKTIDGSIASDSAISLTTATPADVASIELTVGNWDVTGQITFMATSATFVISAAWEGGISTTTATLPTDGTEAFFATPAAIATTTFNATVTIPRKVINITSTTMVYLVAEATFTAGTVSAYGSLTARRVY